MKNLIQSILILIAVHVSTAGAEEVIYAQVGETVTIKPPWSVSLQKDYVYWLFNNVHSPPLAWSNPLGGKEIPKDGHWKDRLSLAADASLVIKNIQQENFGTFFFKQSLSDKIDSPTCKILKLNVSMNPHFPLLPGDFLSLTCSAETLQGHKKPEIHWLNPRGEKMSTIQPLTMKVTSQDNGQWTCVVTNDKKEKKAKIVVTIVDLSPAPLRPRYTSKSWPFTVPCSLPAHISWQQINATGIKEVHWHFVPKPDLSPQRLFSLSLKNPLTWEADQDRGLRPAPDLKRGNLSLTRNRGTEEDRGDYVCSLKFKNGVTLNRTVHVKVLQITYSPATELISGQQLNLNCSLGHPLPSDLRMKWFPPQQSSLTSDHHPAHLTIPEVGTRDSGKWRCELWQKDTRLTSAEIELKIEPRLSVSMLVVICSVTVIVLLLFILVIILYRRRQVRMRHLRHRLCQCKNPKPKGFYRT